MPVGFILLRGNTIMPEIIPCPECAKKIKVPDGAEGKKLRCGNCESILLVTADGLELSRKAAAQTVTEKPAARSTRKSVAVDGEDEDLPKSKRRAQEDEDGEDTPRSKRRTRDDDDDDEDRKPAKKKRKKSGGIPLWVWIASGAAACVLVGVVLWLVLSGGSSFSKVKEGMTEQEITAIAGKPFTSFGGVAMWTNPPLTFEELLDGKKVARVKEVMEVTFVNGKAKNINIQSGNNSGSFNTFPGGDGPGRAFGADPFEDRNKKISIDNSKKKR